MAAPDISACVFVGFSRFKQNPLIHVVSTLLVIFISCIGFGLLATGEKDGIAALKRAWVAVKGNLVGAFLCMMVLAIIGNLGLILCFVGVFVTLPIAFIGSYQMAKQLTSGGVLSV